MDIESFSNSVSAALLELATDSQVLVGSRQPRHRFERDPEHPGTLHAVAGESPARLEPGVEYAWKLLLVTRDNRALCVLLSTASEQPVLRAPDETVVDDRRHPRLRSHFELALNCRNEIRSIVFYSLPPRCSK